MLRAEALGAVLKAFPTEPIVVTLGTTSREVIALAPDAPNHIHLLDSMGLASAVGTGLALALSDRYAGKIVALEGDGGLLMGFSILATLAHLQPPNLVIVVIDDGTYGATGGQWSGSARVDICGVARACGVTGLEVSDATALASALDLVRSGSGPHLIRVRIEPAIRKLPHYLPDPPVLTDRFRGYLRTLPRPRSS